MSDQPLTPLGEKILVEIVIRKPEDMRTASGLFLPMSSERLDKHQEVIVRGIGPKCNILKDGEVKLGDRCLTQKYIGNEVKLDFGKTYFMIHERDLLMKIED